MIKNNNFYISFICASNDVNSVINVNYDLIREDFNVNSIGWSGSNYYWLDKSENVLISKQQISPFGDKIRISK